MRSLSKFALAMTLLAASAAPALAAWPNQPGINLPVCTAANSQAGSIAVSDGAGGAIVAWMDYRSGTKYAVYAQHVLASGTVDPAWPVDGRSMCVTATAQNNATIVSDGIGGAILTWFESRGATSWDIYAQHVLASGVVDPAWPVNGRAICTAANTQWYPVIATDGAGGAYACWQDFRSGTNYDLYAQHVLASGAVDPAWPVDGRAVCAAANVQQLPQILGDGSGGAIVTWVDFRNGISNDIYVQHLLAAGTVDPAWPVDGRALCLAADLQAYPSIVSDGAGGAIVAWEDYRNGTNMDIYAQHVLRSGAVDNSWMPDGRALSLAAGAQEYPIIATDAAGGAFVTWQDTRSGPYRDVYAQHLLNTGATDPTWPADGRPVCTAADNQYNPYLVADGSGGVTLTWQDDRGGIGSDVYAQHVLASGVDTAWPADGRLVSNASSYQYPFSIVTDGAGGTLIVWDDLRNGSSTDVYAQRVAAGGYLGTPEAWMAGVKDVPNDNGGKVKVSWFASYLESAPYNAYTYYYLFRSAPARAANQAIARGARLHAATDATLRPGDLVSMPAGSTTLFWEVLTSVYGMLLPGYSYVAPTTGDSIGAGNPKTLFMVQTRAGSVILNSPPDSGYSVDNIPPVTPAPFAANYAGGATHLHWSPNPDADLANYRLYRDVSPSFTPSPASLLASPPDTGYADVAGATYTYKLTAMDVHGNESPVATITPAAIAGVDGGVAVRELALSPASPNPASRGTTLRFALPAGTNVSLGVYDAAGRLVRTLASGALPAGEHAAAWDLRDTGGRIVGAGLYFARLETGGRTLVRRVAVTP